MRRPSLLALLLLCALALVHAVAGADARYLNLPNKAWWLAPERREETLAWISDWSRWMGAGALALIIGVMHLAGAANRGGTGDLGKGGRWLVAAFVVYALAMLARMALRFSGPG